MGRRIQVRLGRESVSFFVVGKNKNKNKKKIIFFHLFFFTI